MGGGALLSSLLVAALAVAGPAVGGDQPPVKPAVENISPNVVTDGDNSADSGGDAGAGDNRAGKASGDTAGKGATSKPVPSTPSELGKTAKAVSSKRRDIVKPGLEPFEIVSATDSKVAFRLAFKSVRTYESCPWNPAIKPLNGHFLAIDAEASMAGGVKLSADNAGNFIYLGHEAYSIDGVDHGKKPLLTDPAWQCVPGGQVLPAAVGPGEVSRGILLLDVPVNHGLLRFRPLGEAGWEKEF